jgi:hypothetical protein
MSTQTETTTVGCQVTGPDGSAQWDPTYAHAWIGLLQTHRQLTRELDARLEAEHGLTLSGLELLARLAATPERWLRLSSVAAQTGAAYRGSSTYSKTAASSSVGIAPLTRARSTPTSPTPVPPCCAPPSPPTALRHSSRSLIV